MTPSLDNCPGADDALVSVPSGTVRPSNPPVSGRGRMPARVPGAGSRQGWTPGHGHARSSAPLPAPALSPGAESVVGSAGVASSDGSAGGASSDGSPGPGALGGGSSGAEPGGGGIYGNVPSSRPRKTWARTRSICPPFPAACVALARAVILAIAAAACIPGSAYPASVAVPSSSGVHHHLRFPLCLPPATFRTLWIGLDQGPAQRRMQLTQGEPPSPAQHRRLHLPRRLIGQCAGHTGDHPGSGQVNLSLRQRGSGGGQPPGQRHRQVSPTGCAIR